MERSELASDAESLRPGQHADDFALCATRATQDVDGKDAAQEL